MKTLQFNESNYVVEMIEVEEIELVGSPYADISRDVDRQYARTDARAFKDATHRKNVRSMMHAS